MRMVARCLSTLAAVALAVACNNAPKEAARSGPALAHGIIYVTAPAGAIPAVVTQARDDARAAGRTLLVYAGATWCEPCKAFHAAVAAGRLDDFQPALTLLEFDADADKDRLTAAGYTRQFVPLFELPATDGTPSGKFVAGAQKGGNYAVELRAKLSFMLASAATPAAK